MDLTNILFIYIVIVLSAVVHEFSHAAMAKHLGDDTAEREGRLTLNPFVHLDLVGTVVLPLILLLSPAHTFLGWAKPVPYNPYNLRDQKYGNLKVAIAGPISNFIIAIVFGLVLRFVYLGLDVIPVEVIGLIKFVVLVNIMLGLFNLIPVPPLDGSKVLYDLFPRVGAVIMRLGFFGLIIALFVAYAVLFPLTQAIFTLITGSAL